MTAYRGEDMIGDNMNTKDFEKLQKILKDYNIAAVARATGLHKNTIYRIMRGEAKNPSYCTVQTLLEYLRRDKNEPDQKASE